MQGDQAPPSDASHDPRPAAASVDAAELAHFASMAEDWWDPKGKFRPLHNLNPARLGYLRGAIDRHFGREATSLRPFEGLDILDVGCGGGLITEPLRRLGATVTGADAVAESVEVARLHAAASGLDITYRCVTAETLADEGRTYDVIVNLEVVEHVADVDAFLEACRRLVRPGGLMLVSTLNRTPKSFATAIVAAEYVFRWLPRGTHDWDKFLTPDELAVALERAGFRLEGLEGLAYSPLSGRWSLGGDLSVNYLGTALPI